MTPVTAKAEGGIKIMLVECGSESCGHLDRGKNRAHLFAYSLGHFAMGGGSKAVGRLFVPFARDNHTSKRLT